MITMALEATQVDCGTLPNLLQEFLKRKGEGRKLTPYNNPIFRAIGFADTGDNTLFWVSVESVAACNPMDVVEEAKAFGFSDPATFLEEFKLADIVNYPFDLFTKGANHV